MDGVNYDDIMKEVEQQEKELQFTSFTNEMALKIGLVLVERAKREKKSITIDITRHGHQLFHYSCEGTTPDNDQWVQRKSRVVNKFNHSSHYIWALFSKTGNSFATFGVNPGEYAASGGAFPITIKNVGVVGTIAVSGMAQELDHEWVVDAIKLNL
jgi:uncharacterized protein (UPF0303 family)